MHEHQFLVGVAFLVLEIILAFKNGQFPFWTMDYIVLGSKNRMTQKIKQVEVNVRRMQPILVDVVSLVL